MLCSCSVNKFIPDKQYLLDEVDVVSDSKEVKPSLFTSYIRQNPNAKWFNLVKIPMRIYCISGKDSSKWMNRFLQKICFFDPFGIFRLQSGVLFLFGHVLILLIR